MSLATQRRAARERALGLLYEAESKGVTSTELLAELPVAPDEFAVALVTAVDEHRARIDELLERFAQGWSLRRMPALDRAALRMGSAELITRADVPTAVVLAETVDLASRFSTDSSGRFVNGLLARIAREVRSPQGPDIAEQGGTTKTDGDPPRLLPMVDGLIIDLDGVIRHWDPEHHGECEMRLDLPPGTLLDVGLEPERLARSMDGRLTFEGWCQEIGAAVAAVHGADAAAVAEAWASSGWDIDLDVIELIAGARLTVPVALLSNATTHLVADLEWSEIAQEFDVIVSSADIGVAKPAQAAFEAAAEGLGVPLARCLFIDDTPGHVAAARKLGARAEVFTDADGLRSIFRDLGLVE